MLGRRATAVEYALLLAVAFGVPVALLVTGHGIAQLLPLCSAPLVGPLVRTVRSFSAPWQLNAALAGTARLALAFGALFAIALALPRWPS